MPPVSILIKPASGACNLKCGYCFYRNVSELREISSFGIMNRDIARNIIDKALLYANGDAVAFSFQGGEPLLAGTDYFRFFVRYVKEHNVNGSPIRYGIQTNGTLITDEWAEFFTENGFLVGLSLDGDFIGNKYRVMQNGDFAFEKILKGAGILKRHNTDFNILTVVTSDIAERINEIYRFFKENGFDYLQFIPCLQPLNASSSEELYLTDKQYADFLINCFKLYVKDYVDKNFTSIRYFDNLVSIFLGGKPEQCGMSGYCMLQFVIEANGNIYPCDFYCTDEWLLGNIAENDFRELARSRKEADFLSRSLKNDDRCLDCIYNPLCRSGGCFRQKHDADYCEAYKAFFDSCLYLFPLFGVNDNKK